MPATYLVGRAPLAGPLPYGTGPSGDLTVPVIKAKRSAPSSWRQSIHPCRCGRRRQESRTCHGLWRWRESNLAGGIWRSWLASLTCGNVEDVFGPDGSDCPGALTASTPRGDLGIVTRPRLAVSGRWFGLSPGSIVEDLSLVG